MHDQDTTPSELFAFIALAVAFVFGLPILLSWIAGM